MGGGHRHDQVFFQGTTEMGETEALEKAWFVGKGGGRKETFYYGDGVYGNMDGDK